MDYSTALSEQMAEINAFITKWCPDQPYFSNVAMFDDLMKIAKVAYRVQHASQKDNMKFDLPALASLS